MTAVRTIRVVAALLERDGRYLITQRRASAVLPYPDANVSSFRESEHAIRTRPRRRRRRWTRARSRSARSPSCESILWAWSIARIAGAGRRNTAITASPIVLTTAPPSAIIASRSTSKWLITSPNAAIAAGRSFASRASSPSRMPARMPMNRFAECWRNSAFDVSAASAQR